MKPSKILVLSVAFLALIVVVAFGISRFSQKQTPPTPPSPASPTSSTTTSPTTVPQSTTPEKLSLRGSEILDQNGNPIMLRGMNWGSWGTAEEKDAADNVKQGANIIRMPLRWWGKYSEASIDSRKDSAPGHIDPAHLAQLDQYIAWASAQHLWIDLFIDSDCGQNGTQEDQKLFCDPSNSYGDKGHNFWTDPAMRAEFIEVWKFIANRYKDTPYIGMYELLPEPNPTGVSNADIRQFYSELITAIHEVDPRTPLLVGAGPSYTIKKASAEGYIQTDVPLIYTGNLFVFTGKSQEENIANLRERLQSLLDLRTKYNVPIFVQQTGSESGEDPNRVYAAAVLSLLNQNNVGWTWWTYKQHNQNDKGYGVLYEEKSHSGIWSEKTELLSVISKFLKQ